MATPTTPTTSRSSAGTSRRWCATPTRPRRRCSSRSITGAVDDAGITRKEVDFTCAGSCDYVAGQAFSFVQNIDAIGAWPPKRDSHVEMDGAWALYEAWVRLQLGDIDVALAMGSGRSSTADPALIYPMEMDPYYLAPLGADAASLRRAAGPRADRRAARSPSAQMAEVAARCRRDAQGQPVRAGHRRLRRRRRCSPSRLRRARRCAGTTCRRSPTARARSSSPRADKARELCEHPVWITGFAHCSELHYPGMRDLHDVAVDHARGEGRGRRRRRRSRWPSSRRRSRTRSRCSSRRSASAPTSRSTRRAARSPPTRSWRPASSASPRRRGQIRDGGKHRTLAHSTSGPCLQQNLVCVLEGDD